MSNEDKRNARYYKPGQEPVSVEAPVTENNLDAAAEELSLEVRGDILAYFQATDILPVVGGEGTETIYKVVDGEEEIIEGTLADIQSLMYEELSEGDAHG